MSAGHPGAADVPHLAAVVGPTATGKTALAARLATHLGGEVVNADSRQIYRGMDIGTAKPTTRERAGVRHWLIDVVEPDEPFSLARYLELAGEALRDCWSRGRLPIVAGGSGQYVWALLEGWEVPRVAADEELRAELEARADREGPQRLFEELAAVDPESAARVDVSNARRVIRALEIYHSTGKPRSACQTRHTLAFTSTIIGLTCARDELYRRIDARVDAMIAAGLVDEVRGLLDRGFGGDLPAMSGIGYRQVCQHLAGEFSLEEAVGRIKTGTHRLARMQHNWFASADDRIHWIDITAGDAHAEALRVVESGWTSAKGRET